MEPTAFVLGAEHKQWSRENKPVSHNWKKGRGRLDLNQLVGNVSSNLTSLDIQGDASEDNPKLLYTCTKPLCPLPSFSEMK
ncbi:hypothetical protein HOLleu_37506 [Holothuria leucospilota]|uniref:Uncharacterized protein n=1 Tax=Holothuria leucospilota TaxID=206669 RepID=A0A9Q1BCD6_HOLLE|nr:hypothetical protein HOLleu_37506 [Holothuria leucospilota]